MTIEQGTYRLRIANWFRGSRWLAVLAGILILGLLFSQLSPAFLKTRNLQNIAVQASVTGIMAVGMTFVLMTAGIDISVGGILYLTVTVSTWFALNGPGASAPYVAYFVGLLLATLLGLFNGVLTNVLRINPLITTLATLSIFRGAAIHITEAKIINPPSDLRFLGNGQLAGVPMPIVVVFVVMIIGTYLLGYTRFGRYVLAIGSSSRSAYESGLPVKQTLVLVYLIAGLCAGIGGLVMLGRVGTVQSDMGIGIEFTVITAVVLGGTYLSGGRGSIVGSVMGAIFLVMIDNGLNLINASPFIYDIVRGGVLAGAMLIDRATTSELFKTGFPFDRLKLRLQPDSKPITR